MNGRLQERIVEQRGGRYQENRIVRFITYAHPKIWKLIKEIESKTF